MIVFFFLVWILPVVGRFPLVRMWIMMYNINMSTYSRSEIVPQICSVLHCGLTAWLLMEISSLYMSTITIEVNIIPQFYSVLHCCLIIASSPGHSQFFNVACKIEKLGVAWGQGYMSSSDL